MVNFDCHLEGFWNQLGDTLLSIPGEVFPERISWGRNSLFQALSESLVQLMLAAKVFTILLAGDGEGHHTAVMSSWVKQPHHVQVTAFPRSPSLPPSSSSWLFCFVVLALLQCSLCLVRGLDVLRMSYWWPSTQQWFILSTSPSYRFLHWLLHTAEACWPRLSSTDSWT